MARTAGRASASPRSCAQPATGTCGATSWASRSGGPPAVSARSSSRGIAHVLANDRTAVAIDAREASDFAAGSIPGARNIPKSLVLEAKDTGELKRTKDDGRLPMLDHNTRIIVLRADAASARFVA